VTLKCCVEKFAVGCRRLTPGKGYLEALVKPNVEVIGCGISKVVPEGVVTEDGQFVKLDALVTATGFDTTLRPRFDLVGKDGINLVDAWAETNAVEAYFGMTIPAFPNYFSENGILFLVHGAFSDLFRTVFMGPNCPISNGTLVYATNNY
jgi:cation diffusion facilitator CzcD-associated flavoprotein CzcO